MKHVNSPRAIARVSICSVVMCLVSICDAAALTVSSTFDTDADGWLASGDVESITPVHLATGGNPGGTIEVDDQTVGGIWYYEAPDKFEGNKSLAYDQTLSFDLYQRGSGPQFDASDVVLDGAGLTLTIDAGPNPLPLETWQSYSVVLNESAGWKAVSDHRNLAGPDATQEQLQAVLASLDRIRIRGEFITGSDFGRIDNVNLNVVPVPPAAWLFSSAIGVLLARRRISVFR